MDRFTSRTKSRRTSVARSTALAAIGIASIAQAAVAGWPPPQPEELLLTVRETAGIARLAEVVRSGVPLARELGVVSVDDLAVVDAAGVPVPAQFHPMARWNAGLNTSAPLQWVLVVFQATVGANASTTFRLVTDGSAGENPPPAQPIVLTQNGGQWIVDTGAARFALGGAADALFDEVRRGDGTLVVGSSAMTLARGGNTYGHPTVRGGGVSFEQIGPLSVVASIDGAYAAPPAGGGAMGSSRRYVFAAGSPTALVRQSVAWEGSLCAESLNVCPGGAVNGQRVELLRDQLQTTLGAASLALTAVADRELPAVTATAPQNGTASVHQLLRSTRTAPLAYELRMPGQATATGSEADGGMLVASGPAGAVAVALRTMQRYEPQALRYAGFGQLTLDLASSDVWLANHQGLFARFAVAALTSSPPRAVLDRAVWAPLNRPLRAWPSAAWFGASQAVDEFPVGALPARFASYDTLVQGMLENTVATVASRGTAGLTTFGLFPRVWNDPINSDELDCGPPGSANEDPTPADDWDDKFWCTTWTDYHNASATAAIRAMRTGEVEWLDEIAEPAALRTLHTQIFQCAPDDPFDLCGWSPSGYYGYRWDNNNSHAYFENLYLYYWLNGDESLLRLLPRAAAERADRLCAGRGTNPPGPVCAPDEEDDDPCDDLGGRAASQYYGLFRFVGLATSPRFLDDLSSNVARHMTLDYARPSALGAALSFFTRSDCNSFDYIDGPGTYPSDQLWMDSLYTYEVIHRLAVDSEDEPLGLPPIAPGAVESGWGRTLAAVSADPDVGGGPTGFWPNALEFTFTGPRIGGTLVDLGVRVDRDGDGVACEPCEDDDDGDPESCNYDMCLYPEARATLAATLERAADATGDVNLRTLGHGFVDFALAEIAARPLPLAKTSGIRWSVLHAAVARAAFDSLFADGFESGDTGAWSGDAP